MINIPIIAISALFRSVTKDVKIMICIVIQLTVTGGLGILKWLDVITTSQEDFGYAAYYISICVLAIYLMYKQRKKVDNAQ